MATLLDILNDLLQGRGKRTQELKGGLFLQYKKADNDVQESGVFCYRIEKPASDTEIKTVADHLKRILPQGTQLHTDKMPTQWVASDGKLRIGKAVRWSAYETVQATLIDVPATPLLNYTEAK